MLQFIHSKSGVDYHGSFCLYPSNTVYVAYQSFDFDPFYCSACGESFGEYATKENEEGDDEHVCPHCQASSDECFREDSSMLFDDNTENLFYSLKEAFPSVSKCDKWIDREDHAIASNSFAHFGVSEYCGLISLWVVPVEDHGSPGLQSRWIDQAEDKFRKAVSGCYGTDLIKTGAFSNGEGFFTPAKKSEQKGELGLGYSSKCGWV